MNIIRALTRNRAATAPTETDPRLRGRSYVFPFEQVWRQALKVAETSRGWSVVSTDPRQGEIRAEAQTLVWKFIDDMEIRISLDEMGLTRVDATSASRVGRADLGTNARRIARFFRRLDRALDGG